METQAGFACPAPRREVETVGLPGSAAAPGRLIWRVPVSEAAGAAPVLSAFLPSVLADNMGAMSS